MVKRILEAKVWAGLAFFKGLVSAPRHASPRIVRASG